MSVSFQTNRNFPPLMKRTNITEESDFLKGYTSIFKGLGTKAISDIRALSPTIAPEAFSFTNDDLNKYLYGRNNVEVVDIERILRKRKLLDNENTSSKLARILNENKSDELDNIEMTYSIMSFPTDVQLCLSGIPGHKLGVCSKEYMSAGTWIGPYEGKRVAKAKLRGEASESNFCWEIYKDGKLDHFLDGSDNNTSSWMRYIRCARNRHEQNMYVVQYGPNIYYRSFKDINPGEELLVWYESQYEQYFGIPMFIKLSSFGPPSKTRITQGPQHAKQQTVLTKNMANQTKQTSSAAFITQHTALTLPRQFPPEVGQTFTSSIHYSDSVRRESSTSSSPPLSVSPVASPTATDQVPSNDPLEDKEIGLWKCGQCQQRFTQRSALRIHVCPCQANNPYHCGHCNVSFDDPTKLRAHVVTHNNERPFKCGFCSRTFAGATTLNNHVRTHTGQKPFTCEKCGKSFAQASQMSRHQRIAEDCH